MIYGHKQQLLWSQKSANPLACVVTSFSIYDNYLGLVCIVAFVEKRAKKVVANDDVCLFVCLFCFGHGGGSCPPRTKVLYTPLVEV